MASRNAPGGTPRSRAVDQVVDAIVEEGSGSITLGRQPGETTEVTETTEPATKTTKTTKTTTE